MKYRPEIDGLRAVAVIPVIMFHAEYSLFSGGYVGVDVFFVISGFLITSIILNDLENDSFSFTNFYLRRARRLLPALFLVMLSCIPMAWLWLPAGDMKQFAQSIVSTTLFSSNILFWLQSGYFDTSAELKPLLHTWSLSVEEQYYFLVPFLLFCLWKLGNRSYLLLALAVLSAASLLAAVHFVDTSPNAAFFHLPTRFWELGIGALVALLISNSTNNDALWFRNTLSIVGSISIVLAIFLFDKTTPTPSYYTLLPTFGTALIIAYAGPNTIINSVLKWRPFVSIGIISYSLYLWHQPIISFARHRSLGDINDIRPFLFFVIIGLSYLTWRFVEKPVRSVRIANAKFLPLVVTTASFLLVFGISAHLNKGFRERDIAYLEKIHSISLGNYNHNNKFLRKQSWSLLLPPNASENSESLNSLRSGNIQFDSNDSRQKMLIVGDSHSKDIFNLFGKIDEIKDTYQLGRYGVEISKLEEKFSSIPVFKESDAIVIASRYESNDLEVLPEIVHKLVSEEKTVFLVHRIFDFSHAEPFNLADRIVFKHKESTENESDIIDLVNKAYSREFSANHKDQRAYVNSRKALLKINDKYKERIRLVDRMRYVCPVDMNCFGMGPDHAKMFYDYGHHTLAGINFFSRIINKHGFSAIFDIDIEG